MSCILGVFYSTLSFFRTDCLFRLNMFFSSVMQCKHYRMTFIIHYLSQPFISRSAREFLLCHLNKFLLFLCRQHFFVMPELPGGESRRTRDWRSSTHAVLDIEFEGLRRCASIPGYNLSLKLEFSSPSLCITRSVKDIHSDSQITALTCLILSRDISCSWTSVQTSCRVHLHFAIFFQFASVAIYV